MSQQVLANFTCRQEHFFHPGITLIVCFSICGSRSERRRFIACFLPRGQETPTKSVLMYMLWKSCWVAREERSFHGCIRIIPLLTTVLETIASSYWEVTSRGACKARFLGLGGSFAFTGAVNGFIQWEQITLLVSIRRSTWSLGEMLRGCRNKGPGPTREQVIVVFQQNF